MLLAALADDPERLARFTREAQTLASVTTAPESNGWLYAPSLDGQRFLVAVQAETGPPTIHLITNRLKATRSAARE